MGWFSNGWFNGDCEGPCDTEPAEVVTGQPAAVLHLPPVTCESPVERVLSFSEFVQRYDDEKKAAEEMYRAKKGVIYYTHIHKAGGSTFCTVMATANTKHPGRNCNGPDLGRHCCDATLEDLYYVNAWALNQTYGVIANERIMPEHLPFGDVFSYVTTLRHPWDWARSLYNWQKIKFQKSKIPHPWQFKEWILGQPDNWVVRILCGVACREIPNGALTEEHLNYALERLSRFSVIMMTDRYPETGELMRHKFGWQHIFDGPSGDKRGRNAQGTPKYTVSVAEEYASQPGVLAALEQQYSLDMVLYKYADALVEWELHKMRADKGKKISCGPESGCKYSLSPTYLYMNESDTYHHDGWWPPDAMQETEVVHGMKIMGMREFN